MSTIRRYAELAILFPQPLERLSRKPGQMRIIAPPRVHDIRVAETRIAQDAEQIIDRPDPPVRADALRDDRIVAPAPHDMAAALEHVKARADARAVVVARVRLRP